MTPEREEQIRQEAEREYPRDLVQAFRDAPAVDLNKDKRAAYIAGRTAGQREIEIFAKDFAAFCLRLNHKHPDKLDEYMDAFKKNPNLKITDLL